MPAIACDRAAEDAGQVPRSIAATPCIMMIFCQGKPVHACTRSASLPWCSKDARAGIIHPERSPLHLCCKACSLTRVSQKHLRLDWTIQQPILLMTLHSLDRGWQGTTKAEHCSPQPHASHWRLTC